MFQSIFVVGDPVSSDTVSRETYIDSGLADLIDLATDKGMRGEK